MKFKIKEVYKDLESLKSDVKKNWRNYSFNPIPGRSEVSDDNAFESGWEMLIKKQDILDTLIECNRWSKEYPNLAGKIDTMRDLRKLVDELSDISDDNPIDIWCEWDADEDVQVTNLSICGTVSDEDKQEEILKYVCRSITHEVSVINELILKKIYNGETVNIKSLKDL